MKMVTNILRTTASLACLAGLLFAAPMALGQELLHYWNFNEPVSNGNPWPQPLEADHGDGQITYNFDEDFITTFAGTTINAQFSDPSGQSFVPQAGDNSINDGRHFIIAASTVNHENIVLRYATRGTSTGFDTHTIHYSTDGGATWSEDPIAVIGGRTSTSFTLQEIDFTGEPGVDDNPDFQIRITVSREDGTMSSAGNNRFDNITVTGTLETDDPTVSFTSTGATIEEGAAADLTVQINNPDGNQVSVDVVLIEGNAEDFDPTYTTQTVTFGTDATDGETRIISVTAADPLVTSRDAVFELQNIQTTGDAIISSPSEFTLTLEADVPDGDVVFSYWHFNDAVDDWPSPILSDRGRGEISHNLDSSGLNDFAGSTVNQQFGELAGRDFAVQGGTNEINNGRHFQVNVSTVGLEDLVLRHSQRGTSTGFDSRLYEFSTDGGSTWTFIHEGIGVLTATVELAEFNLGTFGDLNDREDVIIRITLDGATAASGNNRFDNITLEGNVLPDARLEAWDEDQGRSGWRMLSAAKEGVTVEDLAGLSLVQGLTDEYPQATPNVLIGYDGSDFQPATLLDNDLEPGRGFLWYLWDEPFVPDEPGGDSRSTGVPLVLAHTGSAPASPVQQTFARPAGDDWFLLGNPFDAPFDVANITADDGMIGNTLYHWDPTGGPVVDDQPQGEYVQLFRDENDEAAVWDGFFAEVSDRTEPAVTFTYTEGPRAGDPNATDRYIVALALDGTVGDVPAYDRNAMVLFSPEATDEWDRFDSSKLYPIASMWAALSPMGDKLGEHVAKAIESRPLPNGTTSVSVAFSSLAGGEFTISLGERTDAPAEWTIELEDTATGQTVDLRQQTVSFTLSEAVWKEERFVVHVSGQPVSTDPGAIEHEFGLAAAYPNPFSGSASVGFTLPEAAEVQLALYDVLGRRVALLAEGEHAAGGHSVRLDSGDLASGVYVVRLTAGGHVASQRVTVVR